MPRCAFLTLEEPTGFVIDDERAVPTLLKLGWRVVTVPWSRPGVLWSEFDAVVVRSTWDYHHRLGEFLTVLDEIEQSKTPLFNSIDLIRWNVTKAYLRDLERRGVSIVPTQFLDRLEVGRISDLFRTWGTDELVLKPQVGANADGAMRLRVHEVERFPDAERAYANRPLLAQPLVRSVLEEGEYSLFYFNGVYSHTVRKTPGTGDFRVQEEHGATVVPQSPSETVLGAARAVHDALPELPLYARVDLVRANEGDGYWLMELELVEPSLYFRMDEDAAGRFARALDERVGH